MGEREGEFGELAEVGVGYSEELRPADALRRPHPVGLREAREPHDGGRHRGGRPEAPRRAARTGTGSHH
eukprot:scaffold153953_cov35-Tisochrysis_lutea.AAC.2